MKQLIILLFTVFMVWSCSEEEHPTGVLIRVENSSSVDFEDILISSGASQVEFGKVAGGSKSDYKFFESAYRYGYVKLNADGKELLIQPFDYVGETPLSPGYYTYQLGLENPGTSSSNLTLKLIVD